MLKFLKRVSQNRLKSSVKATPEVNGPQEAQPSDAGQNSNANSLQGLWIDEPDALQRAQSLPVNEETRQRVIQFIEDGYVIINNAISPELIDQIVADALAIRGSPQHYVVRDKGAYINSADIEKLGMGHRIIDLYAVSSASRAAVFSAPISDLLQAVFGEPAIAIQSLYFEYGSQQAIHQDTAYVVSKKPLALAAIWIALEDIEPGTGELCYYPGGHRFPHFLFGGARKHWNQAKDGPEIHQQFLKSLHDEASQRGISMEHFRPKKGDVLLWHADLPHGGSKIMQAQTRRSLVLHFAPLSVKANYTTNPSVSYHELKTPSGNFFSSRHYYLDRIDRQGHAAIQFDGKPHK